MRSTGSISKKVYAGYFNAGGNWCLIFTVTILCILAQLAASGGDFFIARWVDLEEKYVSFINIKLIKIIKTVEEFDITK